MGNTESSFFYLSPDRIIDSCEAFLNIKVHANVREFNSYVNRVYGIGNDEQNFVIKFYRPGRHSRAAIQAEHDFLASLSQHEISIVPPLLNKQGQSMGVINLRGQEAYFAVFQKRAGRQFDAESKADWTRIGRLIGRIHQASKKLDLSARVKHHPVENTEKQVQFLYDEMVVDEEVEAEFFDICDQAISQLLPFFEKVNYRPLHGDLHRGNILDRLDEGLLLIDFDDCMRGPAVQDLWLMLPDRIEDSPESFNTLIAAYEEFCDFDWQEIRLVEGLRFMRIIHYLAWCCKQRNDLRFLSHFPDWGTKSFWIKELEDLKTQLRFLPSM